VLDIVARQQCSVCTKHPTSAPMLWKSSQSCLGVVAWTQGGT